MLRPGRFPSSENGAGFAHKKEQTQLTLHILTHTAQLEKSNFFQILEQNFKCCFSQNTTWKFKRGKIPLKCFCRTSTVSYLDLGKWLHESMMLEHVYSKSPAHLCKKHFFHTVYSNSLSPVFPLFPPTQHTMILC